MSWRTFRVRLQSGNDCQIAAGFLLAVWDQQPREKPGKQMGLSVPPVILAFPVVQIIYTQFQTEQKWANISGDEPTNIAITNHQYQPVVR